MGTSELREKIKSFEDFTDDNISDYIQEAIKSFDNNCNRSTIILIWNMFIYFLYKKIEEYNLNDFAKLAISKNIKFEGKINTIWDLNKIKDNSIIELGHEIGLYDRNLKNHLLIHSQIRNSSAHVTESKINEYKVYDFISEMYQVIDSIHMKKFNSISHAELDKIRSMSLEDCKNYSNKLNLKRKKDLLKKIIEEWLLFTNYIDLRENENYFIFLEIIIQNSKIEDKRELFKLYYTDLFLSECEIGEGYVLSLLDMFVKTSQIRTIILENDYLDEIISKFIKSSSFENAKIMSKILLHFNNNFTDEQVNVIANAAINNSQIASSFGAHNNLTTIFLKHEKIIKTSLKEDIQKNLEIKFS